MPKSKVRPGAKAKLNAKRQAARSAIERSKSEPTNSGNPGGKTYHGNSLAGAVKLGGMANKPAFHNRKGSGE